jgi:hypothetical protein
VADGQIDGAHAEQVNALLSEAATDHLLLLARLPAQISRSLPVDAQGIQRAIDYLADIIGFSPDQRRDLVRSHAVNPAVLHARVFGAEGLTDSTVLGAFVDGARVRAEALVVLADEAGGESLGAQVRVLLAENPPPVEADGEAITALIDTYKAQEQAALVIAQGLDGLL